MTVGEVKELCILYEQLKTGNRNCKNINKVYNIIPKKTFGPITKNKKIQAIKQYFEKLADDTISQYLINKQNTGDTQNGNIQKDK